MRVHGLGMDEILILLFLILFFNFSVLLFLRSFTNPLIRFLNTNLWV